MASRELESWMWAEAIDMLDRVDRLQRQFFRPGVPQRPQWEPPADVFETSDAVWVVFALPGVSAEHLAMDLQHDVLIVSGARSVPGPARTGVLHRMEIPYGRFERHLPLPFPQLRIAGHQLLDGCLYVQLRKPGTSP